jgi:hypothetical protein
LAEHRPEIVAHAAAASTYPWWSGTPGEAVKNNVLATRVLGGPGGRDTMASMHTTIEAEVDEQGNIRPREKVALPPGSRLLITVLEPEALDTALLSESSLAADWDRPEEDAAWANLGQAR